MRQEPPCRSVLGEGEDELQGDQAFAFGSLLKEAVSDLSAQWPQQKLPDVDGSIDEVAVPEREVTSGGGHGDFLRACVWHRSEWHPMPPAQQRQIASVLGIEDGCNPGARLSIDGTDPVAGWVTQRGIRSAMKLVDTTCRPDTILRLDGPETTTSLIQTFQQEWRVLSEGKASMEIADMKEAFGRLASERCFNDLYVPVAADLFRKVDFDNKSLINANKWLHYRLLQNQAPSLHAMRQINASLRVWLRGDAAALDRLLSFFVESGEGVPRQVSDGWITGRQMKNLASKWLACRKGVSLDDIGMEYIELGVQSAMHLERLINGNDVVEQDAQVSYYEFLTHIFGRGMVTVELYFYDISGGGTSWWSPLLFRERWPAIWHTSIHVHNKEYRYGGNIYESIPGMTPFGKPMKVEVLGETTRTREDLLFFIDRQLSPRFSPETYQALTNNSNHFSDALGMFLTNTHIPGHVLNQVKVIRESSAAVALRPLLPWLKGDIRSNTKFENIQNDVWEKVSEGQLVTYEYEEGWTCVARLKVKRENSCDLLWLDTGAGGIVREQKFVDRAAVQPLNARSPCRMLPVRKT